MKSENRMEKYGPQMGCDAGYKPLHISIRKISQRFCFKQKKTLAHFFMFEANPNAAISHPTLRNFEQDLIFFSRSNSQKIVYGKR